MKESLQRCKDNRDLMFEGPKGMRRTTSIIARIVFYIIFFDFYLFSTTLGRKPNLLIVLSALKLPSCLNEIVVSITNIRFL